MKQYWKSIADGRIMNFNEAPEGVAGFVLIETEDGVSPHDPRFLSQAEQLVQADRLATLAESAGTRKVKA